ncbi:MAG: DNA polymerase III subunit delta [Proteobacteria bacterium]|nr:DNA polymerase III subunit delta [Pseudomonadota bacterium]MBQ4359001.1 DNA polymerase III subunit delta [Pseudomonadota bacterium]
MSKQVTDESPKAFKHLSSADPLERVYLFYGEDTFILNKLVEAVAAKRFKGKEPDPLSWENYRASDTDTQKVLDAVRTFSMFGGPKVVVYQYIDKLNEADLQKIADYAQSPAKAHLVLTATAIDGRKKTWKTILGSSYSAACPPLTEYNAANYLRSFSKDLKLTPEAIDVLVNCVGPNRALLNRALEKLSLAITDGQPITAELVEEHVIDARERNVFELTKAITKRNIPAALEALRVLIDQKQEPIMINIVLARHARMMLLLKLGKAKNLSNEEIKSLMHVSSDYALREYQEGIQNYSLGELYRFHSDIYEADKSMKSKPVPPIHVLSRVLLNLCAPVK